MTSNRGAGPVARAKHTHSKPSDREVIAKQAARILELEEVLVAWYEATDRVERKWALERTIPLLPEWRRPMKREGKP